MSRSSKVATSVPQGLRLAYQAALVVGGIFGVAGIFLSRTVGDIAKHPVRDIDVNMLMGAAALAFAVGAWSASRAASWAEVRILTLVLAVFGLVGGIGGLIIYFAPGLVGEESLPAVTLLIGVVLLAMGGAFTYYYRAAERA